jgi:hypothetical protein
VAKVVVILYVVAVVWRSKIMVAITVAMVVIVVVRAVAVVMIGLKIVV